MCLKEEKKRLALDINKDHISRMHLKIFGFYIINKLYIIILAGMNAYCSSMSPMVNWVYVWFSCFKIPHIIFVDLAFHFLFNLVDGRTVLFSSFFHPITLRVGNMNENIFSFSWKERLIVFGISMDWDIYLSTTATLSGKLELKFSFNYLYNQGCIPRP